jgi:hypothetical protein
VLAQEQEVDPPHYLGSWTAGAPLRLTRNVDFDQDAIAPVFSDVLVGYAFSGPGAYRHGLGVGGSLNLSQDGGFTEPVQGAAQFVLMPAYLAYYALDPDWLLLGHLGVPVLLSGGRSLGLELAAGLGYRVLSGAGVFGEAGFDAFAGADTTLHLSFSLELGIFIDHEVLP